MPDLAYLTAFHYGGFTNQVIENVKLIYLAKQLDRVPILPDLWPQHDEGSETPFSDFFDLDRLADGVGLSVLNWAELKQDGTTRREETEWESLGCWGQHDDHALWKYKTKTDFWPVPPDSADPALTFDSWKLDSARDHAGWLATVKPVTDGPLEEAAAPDEHLMCIGNMFWFQSLTFKDGKADWSTTIEEVAADDPVWTTVGRHLHFSSPVEAEADRLMASLLPPTGSGKPPAFVGVHLRQGDFLQLGRITRDLVDDFVAGAAEVQQELRASKLAVADLPVLFTTDSQDPALIGRLIEVGWVHVDHRRWRTTERLGGWWPGLLDSVVLSRAVGFVGTRQSTFSYTAARRVESWQGGISRIVG